MHLGYAGPFDDELPSADFDFAEPFEDDATAGPTKSEPLKTKPQ